MTQVEFLSEVRRRRNHFLLWWFGALIPIYALRWVFGHLPRGYFTFEPGNVFAVLTWFCVWLWLGERQCGLRCIYCGNRAFGFRPFFSTNNLKCQACGRSFNEVK